MLVLCELGERRRGGEFGCLASMFVRGGRESRGAVRRGSQRRGMIVGLVGGQEMDARNGMMAVHPGEILREELDERGLSADALSKALGVPVNRVTMILNGQRGVTADTALRLARYFGTTPQLWLNLQKTWELRRTEIAAGREIAEQVAPRQGVV